jgi:serine/threonine-protein kinase RsbW
VTGAYPVLSLDAAPPSDPLPLSGPPRPPAPPLRALTHRRCARTFHGTPASVPEARRYVAGILVGCPARETLVTCTSELCTNAIEHTASGDGGVFTVEVERPRDGVARVAVTDAGSPSVPAPGSVLGSHSMAEGGRGLALVAAYAARWGYADAAPGRTVWAEATWPVPVPSPSRSPEPTRFPDDLPPGSAA